MKYKINYYCIILDFTTNTVLHFAVIPDLKSRSLLHVNSRRRAGDRGGSLAERKKNIGFLRFIAASVSKFRK